MYKTKHILELSCKILDVNLVKYLFLINTICKNLNFDLFYIIIKKKFYNVIL